jgi:hypothetical protein
MIFPLRAWRLCEKKYYKPLNQVGLNHAKSDRNCQIKSELVHLIASVSIQSLYCTH